MIVTSGIVAGPNWADLLGAGKDCSGENKRPVIVVSTLQKAFCGGHVEVVTVSIMDVSVLNVTVVQIISGHASLHQHEKYNKLESPNSDL